MLQTVSVPVAELAAVKPTHVHVLLGLLSFADAGGRCWPSLRTLAEITGMKLSRVHRAIAEMEAAGLLTRIRRGAGTLYQLAERFVWRAIRSRSPSVTVKTEDLRPKGIALHDRLSDPQAIRPGLGASYTYNAEPAAVRPKGVCDAHPLPSRKMCATVAQVSSASGTLSPASETEGLPRKELEEDFKREDGPVRLAPPEGPCAPNVHGVQFNHCRDVPETVGMPNGDSPGVRENVGMPNACRPHKPAARPASGPNPFARRQWLRTLNTYVSERLAGPQQWAGWEVVAKAETGALEASEQRLIDGIDRMMRRSQTA